MMSAEYNKILRLVYDGRCKFTRKVENVFSFRYLDNFNCKVWKSILVYIIKININNKMKEQVSRLKKLVNELCTLIFDQPRIFARIVIIIMKTKIIVFALFVL